jgi:HSP20 family protein
MNLARWNQFRESRFQNQLNRLFEDALHTWPSDTNGTSAWSPAADIFETDNDLVLQTDLPGVDPKQIDLRVENNVLTIRGERRFEPKVERENFHRVERSYGTFSRSFALATAVESEKVQASYKNGVLSIMLPKTEQAKPKRIQIAGTAA